MTAILAQIRALIESARDDAAFEAFEASMYGEPPSPAAVRRYAARLMIERAALAAICALRGHRIEVESYAGPESAEESHSCSRCGRGLFHHIYY
jgi:hypothetical protein